MAQHAPDVLSIAKCTLPSGLVVSLVFDHGKPQGAPFEGLWWRLERYLVPANSIISALEGMLPEASTEIAVKSCTRAESTWYPELEFKGAVEAARTGQLDAWWAGKPSATWWGGLPAEVKGGFMGLLALSRV